MEKNIDKLIDKCCMVSIMTLTPNFLQLKEAVKTMSEIKVILERYLKVEVYNVECSISTLRFQFQNYHFNVKIADSQCLQELKRIKMEIETLNF